MPVVLRTGQEFRAPLKTSAKAELMIELVLNRHEGVADDVIDKILTRETGAVNVAWLVRKDGTTHFSGSSTNARKFFAGSAAERTKGLGQFKPQQSGTYEFVATLHSDLPELERARPRIVVRPNRAQAMNASMGGSVGVVGGFVLGLFGVIVLLLARREDQSCVR